MGNNKVCVTDDTKLHLQVSFLGGSYMVTLTDRTTDELYDKIDLWVRYRTLLSGHVYIMYGCKPLLRGRLISDYCIPNYGSVTVEFPQLLGGGEPILPPYKIVQECERMVIAETAPTQVSFKKTQLVKDAHAQMDVQSYDEEARESAINTMIQHILKGLEKMPPLGVDQRWIIKQIENFSILRTFSRKCESIGEYYCLTQMAYRLFTGEVLSTDIDKVISRLFQTEVQSLDVGDTLKFFRQAFDGITNVTESELSKKLVSLYSYLLTQGYLKYFGIELNDEDYSKMEQRALLSAFSSKKNFYVCVIDTVLFVAERIHEYSITGDITSFVHSSGRYTKWLKEADRIINLAPFTGNLQAHDTSYFSYIADLRDLCEQGQAYCKYLKMSSGIEATLIARKLNTLQMLSNTEITRRAAMKERAQPMGVLVSGHSSIAKSAFTKMLFNYYGSLFDLERGDDFRYVRNPMDEYWSNFDTSKWCIQLDDIAFKHPSKSADIDSTLQDLLNVVNNVPYVPPQAALEDKGKTPVLAELVIATTNCETLNAQEYFWCPLAVRRRLPYVISLRPKDEFLHANQSFIDPQKIKIEDGSFPDLWEITVKTIVPRLQYDREMADLEVVKIFNNVKEFLQHFGLACKQHKKNQARAMSSDIDMQKIEVCRNCLMPLPHDECVSIQSFDAAWYTSFLMFNNILNWLFGYMIFWKMLDYMVTTRFLRSCAFRIVNRLGHESKVIAFYGRFIEFKRSQHTGKLCAALSVLSLLFGAYYIFGVNSKNGVVKEKEGKTAKYNSSQHASSVDESLDENLIVQGNLHGTTEEQLEKETSSNVWYNPTIELTTFDVPKASTSLVGASVDQIRDLFSKNCVLLRIKVDGELTTRIMRGVFIKGHRCVTNGHAFKETGDNYTVEIIRSGSLNGVNSNIKIQIKRRDIAFSSTSDVCIFDVDSIPPFKDITTFWVNQSIDPTSCVAFMREVDGSVSKRNVFGLTRMNQIPVETMSGKYDIHYGKSDVETAVGMCGSLCVSITPRGPIIVGLHFLGKGHFTGILSVQLDELKKLEQQTHISTRPIVQAGEAPSFACEDREVTLGPIHHKSLFRYIEQGTVNVYGSILGFRPRPKSSVTATPLQREMLDHYKTEVKYDKPVMNGWVPWRNNVVEMVKPNVTYDRLTLRKAKEGFLKDILEGLPKDWEKELVILSDTATVNGLPGVKFIDRIATNTSMGFPWCTTKKKYLKPEPSEKYPEGVNFGEEIWERVRNIESKYSQGKRVYPVFTGHLKDEATLLKKCKIGKTRLFTGAPIDWSLVVRKNLLSFVRLLQKNKFVFEAGPGTVCQSMEWGIIYEYLTSFGADRMVAGDYGKYDKRMLADFILAAFEIIVEIYRTAGFDDETLLRIMCIGEDTAFSVCNISGDLVEFFGTNPSGHPLTVIINSLVNSLYMRYCYCKLNPQNEVHSFKKNVHLFTYGDDNTCGVSRRAEFFNHTAIQAEMAKIGVEYTMADKESESVPFIHIDDVSFLKRKWVWSEDVDSWICPLEEESIIKSLTVWVPSKSIDKYAQMVAVISSANNEYFFHGREKFGEKRKFFQQMLSQEPFCFYVSETTLPTFDELVERFKRSSEGIELIQFDSDEI